MTRPRFDPVVFRSALLGAFTVLLLPACRTEEINPNHTIFSFEPTDSSQGGLIVIVAPTAETAAEVQADPQDEPTYHLVVDGREVMWYGLPANQPLVLGGVELGPAIAGFYEPGPHHFELAATDSPAVFTFDGIIAGGGALNRLYVFGPRGGIQTRFVSYPNEPPAGNEHLSVINLVRAGGVQIEVVSCTDAATCTPVSPPLALGDTFDADFPIGTASYNGLSLSDSGAGYGYRQVAPALPTPPINLLEDGFQIMYPVGAPTTAYVGAPIYMSSDGNMMQESD
jgi:hypothetical protein